MQPASGVSRWPAPPPDRDPDSILEDIMSVIEPAIERFIPMKEIIVRRDTPDLFLSASTRRVIRARDQTRASHSRRYKYLRNLAVRLVRGDKARTAVRSLRNARDPQAEAWRMAKNVLH